MLLQKTNISGNLELYAATTGTARSCPFIASGVQAGFPSPAEDFSELSIDLNTELLKNPHSSFFCRVNGDSMEDIGICDGDLLVVDKSLEPANGKVAVCFIDGEFTLKTIRFEKGSCWLVPANKKYKPIRISEENDFLVWGIVSYAIKKF